MALTLMLAMAMATQAPFGPDCRTALAGAFDVGSDAPLAGQIDGAAIAGPEALAALRAERGDTPLIIAGGNFPGADFRGARLHNICFLGTDLSGSDWRGAQAPGVAFVRADLSGARLSDARMRGILLREPHMPDVDASRADFSEGRLAGSWNGSLAGLRLDGANLRGFRFECGITVEDGCPIDGEISFRGADLQGAAIDTYWGAGDWTGARLGRTIVRLEQLLDFAGADLVGPLTVRGGDAAAELAPAEVAALRPHIGPPGEAPAPSFDCARAVTAPEGTICGPEGGELRGLDLILARLYPQAAAADPTIAASQQQWLARRDACLTETGLADLYCIAEAYERRKAELIARIGAPSWARPGAVALFAAPAVEFDEAARDGPLYARLVPVIVGGAWSRAAVRVNDDGTIDARGDALAANAHLCSLAGNRLRFDPATGWYSGPQQPNDDDPPEWRGRPMPVLLLFENRAEIFQGGRSSWGSDQGDPRFSDYASCGARAAFLSMVRVPVPEAEARRAFDSYEDWSGGGP